MRVHFVCRRFLSLVIAVILLAPVTGLPSFQENTSSCYLAPSSQISLLLEKKVRVQLRPGWAEVSDPGRGMDWWTAMTKFLVPKLTGKGERGVIQEEEQVPSPTHGKIDADLIQLVASVVAGAPASQWKQAFEDGNPATLEKLFADHPGNPSFIASTIEAYATRQFPETNRPITELILNGIDSMLEGVTVGRFGVGFYAMMKYLQEPDARVVVRTSTGREAWRIIFYNKAGRLRVRIAADSKRANPGARGTIVRLMTRWQALNPYAASQSIRDTLAYNTRYPILVEEEDINEEIRDPSRYEKMADAKADVAVFRSRSMARDGKGKVVVTVNGVRIFDREISGCNIPQTTVLDFPATTDLLLSRNTLEMNAQDIASAKAILELVPRSKEPVTLLNALIPLMKELQEKSTSYALQDDLVQKAKTVFNRVTGKEGTVLLPNAPNYFDSNGMPLLDWTNVTYAHRLLLQEKDTNFLARKDFEKAAPLHLLEHFVSDDFQLYRAPFRDADSAMIVDKDSKIVFVNEACLAHGQEPVVLAMVKACLDFQKIPHRVILDEDAWGTAAANTIVRAMGGKIRPGEPETQAISRGKPQKEPPDPTIEVGFKTYPRHQILFILRFLGDIEPPGFSTEVNPKNLALAAVLLDYVTAWRRDKAVEAEPYYHLLGQPENRNESAFGHFVQHLPENAFLDNAGLFDFAARLTEEIPGENRKAFIRGIRKPGEYHLSEDPRVLKKVFESISAKRLAKVLVEDPIDDLGDIDSKGFTTLRVLERMSGHAEILEGLNDILGEVQERKGPPVFPFGDLIYYLNTRLEKASHVPAVCNPVFRLFRRCLEKGYIPGGHGVSFLNDTVSLAKRHPQWETPLSRMLFEDPDHPVWGYLLWFFAKHSKEMYPWLEEILFSGSHADFVRDVFRSFPKDPFVVSPLGKYFARGAAHLKPDEMAAAFRGKSPDLVWKVLVLRGALAINYPGEYDNKRFLETVNRLIANGRRPDSLKECDPDKAYLDDFWEAAVFRERGYLTKDPRFRPYWFYLTTSVKEWIPLPGAQPGLVFPTEGVGGSFRLSDRIIRYLKNPNLDLRSRKTGTSEGIRDFLSDCTREGASAAAITRAVVEAEIFHATKATGMDPYSFLRQAIRNASNAGGKALRLELGVQGPRSPKGKAQLVLSMQDEAGMDVETALTEFLIPFAPAGYVAMRNLGNGLMEMMRKGSRVLVKTSDGKGRVLYMEVERSPDKEDFNVRYAIRDEIFRGTHVQWSAESDLPEADAAFLRSSVQRYADASPRDRMQVILRHGGKDRVLNHFGYRDVVGSVKTSFGTLNVYRSKSKNGDVTQDGVFLKSLDEEILGGLPPPLRELVLREGYVIDLPEKVPKPLAGEDIPQKEFYMPEIQAAVARVLLPQILKELGRKRGKNRHSTIHEFLVEKVFPYDYFYEWHAPETPESIVQDARRLFQEDIPALGLFDPNDYAQNSKNLYLLLGELPVFSLQKKLVPLKELVGLPDSVLGKFHPVGDFIREMRQKKYDNEKTFSNAFAENRETSLAGNRPLPARTVGNARQDAMDVYWAFDELMLRLSDLLLGANRRKTSTAFFNENNDTIARTSRGSNVVAWNLHLNREFLELFGKYLANRRSEGRGLRVQPMDAEKWVQKFADCLETNAHETLHLKERTGEGTHGPDFHEQLWHLLTRQLVRHGQVVEILRDVSTRYRGTYQPNAAMVAYLKKVTPLKGLGTSGATGSSSQAQGTELETLGIMESQL